MSTRANHNTQAPTVADSQPLGLYVCGYFHLTSCAPLNDIRRNACLTISNDRRSNAAMRAFRDKVVGKQPQSCRIIPLVECWSWGIC